MHYSKPDIDRRVTFAAGAVSKATTTASHEVDKSQLKPVESEEPAQRHESTETISEKIAVRVGEDGEVGMREQDDEELVRTKRQQEDKVLRTRVSFLRQAIAGLCAQCMSVVIKRQSVEHCSLLCIALELYGGPETVISICNDNLIMSLLDIGGERGGERDRGGEGDGERGEGVVVDDKGSERDSVVPREGGGDDRRGTFADADQRSVNEMIVQLTSCLLRAIDCDVISGRDPLLIGGVVSCILLLLQTEGVSMDIVTDTLCKIVQVGKA